VLFIELQVVEPPL